MAIRSRLRKSPWWRYLLAVALPFAALLLHFALQAIFGPTSTEGTYQFFLMAVALSAIWTGRYGALLTWGLSIFLRLWFFVPPTYSVLVQDTMSGVQLILFSAVGLLIAWVGGALYDSEDRFSAALSSIGDAVITTDRRRLIRFMNPVAERLTGWSTKLAKGRPIEEVMLLVDERTKSEVEIPVGEAIQHNAPVNLRAGTALIARSGIEISIEDNSSPISGGMPQSAGAVVVFRDVTQQRLAQRDLEEGERRYRFLADAVPDFIFTANLKGECEYFNRRWRDYTGQTEDQFRGFKWTSALHPDDVAPTLSKWTDSVASGREFKLECRVADKGGDYRTFLLDGLPMADPAGEVKKLFGVFTDIDDFKRTERQLHQAQKMEALGRLAGGVAHDFNNLLTVFSGYGCMLRDEMQQGTLQWIQADQICRAAEQASAFTRQLLSFSRRQVSPPAILDLNGVVEDIHQMLSRVIGEDVALETSFDPNLKRIRADRGQITQILMNLSVNARDAMPRGGRLVIETSNVDLDEHYAATHGNVVPGPYVMLAVSDTGEGMDLATQSHAFEPFFTTKAPGKGTGLGLSTVYGIVTQNGGSVWLYSEPGKGTTVKMYFPVALEETQPKTGAPVVQDGSRGTESVLVVEDQATVLTLIENILTPRGYRVLHAGSAEEALRLCREPAESIDLLLTDVVMPGMSGLKVADEAAKLRPSLKVLYMSGYTDEMIGGLPAFGPGVNFIQKPFTADLLLQKVRESLDAHTVGRL